MFDERVRTMVGRGPKDIKSNSVIPAPPPVIALFFQNLESMWTLDLFFSGVLI